QTPMSTGQCLRVFITWLRSPPAITTISGRTRWWLDSCNSVPKVPELRAVVSRNTDMKRLRGIWLPAILALSGATKLVYSRRTSGWRDPSAHTVEFVTVDENVGLEVLEWRGSGPSVVLLAGGDTACVR